MSDSSTAQGADREESETAAEPTDPPVAVLRAAPYREPTLVDQLALHAEPDDLPIIYLNVQSPLGLGELEGGTEDWAGLLSFRFVFGGKLLLASNL